MNVRVVESVGPDRAAELAALYGDHDWWADRDEESVRRALANTDLAVGLADGDSDRLVAAARVLTDYTYYARVYDVIVAAERRGEGLGSALLAAVREHPDLAGVDALTLGCRQGLVEFYGAAGFAPDETVPGPDGQPEPYRHLRLLRDGDE